MRHIIITALLAASLPSMAFGQAAAWLKKPIYDNVAIAQGANILLADSASSTVLLNFEGKRLGVVPDSVCAFNENVAVTLRRGSANEITGFVTADGAFTSLEDKGLRVAMDYPFFTNGMLLVKGQRGFGFVNSKSETPIADVPVLYPFHNGYAPAMLFADPKKQKDTFYALLDKDCGVVKFIVPGRGVVEPKDVDFVSSVSDDGKCIVVIKKKLYEYAPASGELTALFSDTDYERKHQIQVNGEMVKWLQPVDGGFELTASIAKNQPVTFRFNPLFQPTEVRYPNMTSKYRINEPVAVAHQSNLSGFMSGGKAGLRYNDDQLCPPQFESVDLCVNDIAVVTQKGRKGIVGVAPSQPIKLIMNRGDDIPFRHQKFNTTIRLQLPPEARADKYNIDIAQDRGVIIDPTSRRFNNTDNGNWVQYDCTLLIPDSLPATLTTLTYPVTIVNDGLRLSDMPLNVTAWHYRYHTVDIDESELVIENGNVLFPVAISAERMAGDMDYPVALSIQTNGQKVEIDKISETLYKCKILDLVEGPNSFNVVLREKGCPPIVHPFMVDYTKGKRTRGRTVKEAAAIQRQSILQNATAEGHDATTLPDQQANFFENGGGNVHLMPAPAAADTVPAAQPVAAEAAPTDSAAAPSHPSTLDLLQNFQQQK